MEMSQEYRTQMKKRYHTEQFSFEKALHLDNLRVVHAETGQPSDKVRQETHEGAVQASGRP